MLTTVKIKVLRGGRFPNPCGQPNTTVLTDRQFANMGGTCVDNNKDNGVDKPSISKHRKVFKMIL